MSASFTGAALPVCGVDVLIVVVQPWILADPHEAQLYVIAFALRFDRTIVLMAQDDRRVPTYYGPAPIVRALGVLPFEIIPWQRMPYQLPRPRAWQLPIPPEPPPYDSRVLSASLGDSDPPPCARTTAS
ncbi:MAG: hypothetical protein H0T89_13785 [Deltaproteobacteria bacterium]|nr:hypothetical protein [Deltaproteobacteria bacterium]MDQ3299006.1 hypothetical protein [Myxococcota bacterium]